MRKDSILLFVTGRLAVLHLGSAAPNIGGARTGAERIALVVDQVLQSQSESGDQSAKRSFLDEEDSIHVERKYSDLNHVSGTGSMFSSLEEILY